MGLACAVALLWPTLATASEGEKPPPAVLILLPGQPTGTQTGIDAFAAGARKHLLDNLPAGSFVYMEYTDLARLGKHEEHAKLRDWYKMKYAGRPLDLLIAGGQEPRAFLLRYRSELWPDVPIIFGGMDERSLKGLSLPNGTTAVTTKIDEEGTIRAALRLLPDTNKVALVTGASRLDRYLGEFWREALARIENPLEVIELAALPLGELKERLKDLPPRTIVLFSTIFVDGRGRSVVQTEILPTLAAASNRPIFAVHDSFLGLGIVGGLLVDYSALGRQAATVALPVLGGAPMPTAAVKTAGVNSPRFDWRELRRWRIDERRLPKGSAVLYRPPSAWELYRWRIIIGLSALVAQALLIAGLLMQHAQRRRVQHELDERLRFETFLGDLSRSFVDVPAVKIDDEIPHGLRRIGEFLDLDRVSLFELAERMGRARVMATWSADGIEPVPGEMPARAFPWISPRIARGEVVTFSRRDELPPAAGTDAASFAAYGTRSHALIPLAEGGPSRTVLALSTVRSERTWPEALIERLRLVAEVLGGILARKHAELEVEESRELQRAMLSSLPSLMAVLDRSGQVLAVNRAWLDHPRTNEARPVAHLGVGRNYLEAAREAVLAGVPGARDVLAAVQAALADTRELSEVEYKGVGLSSGRWFRLSAMALRGSKGGAVIAYTDVTDHLLAREQLQQFSGQLLAAQEEERRRIARELHDDFNQRLVLLALEISQPERDPVRGKSAGGTGRRVAERLGEIASDVHRLAYRLHPFKLEYLGLTAAARGFCQEIATAHEITIEFAERDVPSGLPREVALCVYRVLQEALSNVVRHSGSAYAKVELYGDDAGLSLTVRDFGAGLGPRAGANTHGLGLASMRERLRLVNGTLSVDSSQAGTQLEVQIPIPVLAPVR